MNPPSIPTLSSVIRHGLKIARNPVALARELAVFHTFYKVMRLHEFDEEAYLDQNPDVAAAIRAGQEASARGHYIRFGCAEGRSPTRKVDPRVPYRVASRRRRRSQERSAILAEIAARAGREHLYPLLLDIAAGTGDRILKLNRRVVRTAKADPLVTRFNYDARRPEISVIICLYGHPQFLSLQLALFSTGCRLAPVEFIFLNNSAEHGEFLLRDAKQAARLYEIPVTLINVNENIGLAAGNNLAARHATSSRLVFMHPDVFPRDHNWLAKHNEFSATADGRIFGACLYYDDVSFMHAGMYLERETIRYETSKCMDLLRIRHYAKGVPDCVPDAAKTRVVPAITGAFISIEREHFESLKGFDENFVLAGYEDFDLCLRSAAAGQRVWYCANVRLMHLEAQGGARGPDARGASYVNQWLFSRKWLPSLANKCGPLWSRVEQTR